MSKKLKSLILHKAVPLVSSARTVITCGHLLSLPMKISLLRLAEMRPLINHVVMVEKSRENTHDHLDYEGVLTVETLSAVNQRRLERRQEHIYSVTELEIYARCPFQYFINNVLKFRVEEDETEDELSGLERGSLLHDVLFEFYNNRHNQKRLPIGQCNEEAFKEAKAQLNELLDSNAEKKRNRRKEKLIARIICFGKPI